MSLENNNKEVHKEYFDIAKEYTQKFFSHTAGLTHKGARRENQDQIGVYQTDTALYMMVTDGMGGQTNGKNASEMVQETFKDEILQENVNFAEIHKKTRKKFRKYIVQSLKDSYEKDTLSSNQSGAIFGYIDSSGNIDIENCYERIQDSNKMGACYILCELRENGILKTAQSGDVKLIIRNEKTKRVRETLDEGEGSTVRNALLSSSRSTSVCTQSTTVVNHGDRIIIASDGIIKNFSDVNEIFELIQDCKTPAEAVALVSSVVLEKMNRPGASKKVKDNIGLIIHFVEDEKNEEEQEHCLQNIYNISDEQRKNMRKLFQRQIFYDTLPLLSKDKQPRLSQKGLKLKEKMALQLASEVFVEDLLSKEYKSFQDVLNVLLENEEHFNATYKNAKFSEYTYEKNTLKDDAKNYTFQDILESVKSVLEAQGDSLQEIIEKIPNVLGIQFVLKKIAQQQKSNEAQTFEESIYYPKTLNDLILVLEEYFSNEYDKAFYHPDAEDTDECLVLREYMVHLYYNKENIKTTQELLHSRILRDIQVSDNFRCGLAMLMMKQVKRVVQREKETGKKYPHVSILI